MPVAMRPQNTIDSLLAMMSAFREVHRVPPSYVLVSADVFANVSKDVGNNRTKYKGVVGLVGSDITIDGVEVGQLPGQGRAELVIDPDQMPGRRLLV